MTYYRRSTAVALRNRKVLRNYKVNRQRHLFIEQCEDRALLASVFTDEPDYLPGETALITAEGYAVGETVRFQVLHIDGTLNTGSGHDPWVVTDASDGTADGVIHSSWFVNPDDSAGSIFELSAFGLTSSLYDTYTFTDAPPSADNLNQWDPVVGDPTQAWVTGNNNGPYFEGDTVPYYISFSNLIVGDTYTVTIEWDTTKASKHAIDYILSLDETITPTSPAVEAGVTVLTTDTFAIPLDPHITADVNFVGTQLPGVISGFNADITAMGSYIITPAVPGTYVGDTSTSITITFIAQDDGGDPTTTDSLLAWGGHIASRADWGNNNSAVSISGSPYHMRIEAFHDDTNNDDLGAGQNDRSLSADAVIFPAQLTIIKDTVPDAADDFSFSVTGDEVTPFTLDDDADGTLSNTQTFLLTSFGAANTRTVTEFLPGPTYALTNLVCTEDPGGVPQVDNSTTNLGSRTATIIPEEGEIITCTYTNTLQTSTLTLLKTVVNDNGGTAIDTNWTLNAAGPTPISGVEGSVAVTNATVLAGDYTLSETGGPAGYTATLYSCVVDAGAPVVSNSLTLAPGSNATCTITNADNPPTLTLVKVVVNDNGGTATPASFTLTATGPTGFSGPGPNVPSPVSFDAGTYDLSESAVAGYSNTGWVCVGGSQGDLDTVTVGLGENVTCTITNTDNPPTLTLVKVVTNDNGGTATPASFTLTATGPTGFSGPGPNVLSPASFDAGTYDLSESAVAGYSNTGWVCVGGTQGDLDTVTVGLGQNVTCTITNTDNPPTLMLVKVVVNDNGGTATPANFTLTAAGPTGFSGPGPNVPSPASFDAGTYDLSELAVAGYSNTGWVCVGGTQGDLDTVTVALGQNVTCTITNTDNPPTLTLVKVVINDNGGTAVESDFTLTATGPTGFSGPGPNVPSPASFDAGTYDLSENAVVGYSNTGWSCVGGTQNDTDTVTIALGQNVTCTITNNDISPGLTLVKIVTNDNGGTATPASFTLTATGPTGFSGPGPNVTSPAVFSAGTYDLSESAVAGYSASAWVCVGGTQNDIDTVTVGLGESVTCTITNTDNPPTLTLVKVVINDNGGTAVASDFTLTAAGPTGFNGPGPNVPSPASFDAGVYDLSETLVAGYSASAWICVGGTQNDADTVTVALGQNVTCTITNTDNPPTLTLVKVVVNDNGGTATPASFTLTAAGPTGFSGPGPNVPSPASFDQGTYNLSESAVVGYSNTGWVCVGGTQNDTDTVTVGLGQNVTCTITNTDNPPTLTLVKIVTNDNGGTAVTSDFTLTATGPTGFSGPGPNVLSPPSFDAGTYDLSENVVPGYSNTGWVCVGGSQGDLDTVTVALGQNVTCTITNTDNPPTLTLVKVVINDNGGTAVASNFTLTATGPTGFSGPGPNVPSPASFDAGVYALSETTVTGYTASAWVCVGGTQNGSDITVGLGDNVTCTITNTDNPPTLTLVKVVQNDNGGTATPASFTLFAAGPTGFSGPGPNVPSPPSFDAGTYNLFESVVAGYTASAWICVGGNQNDVDTVTVALGQNVTCTITNTDDPPSLTLVKVVINDNGGTAVATDFTLTATGPTPISGPGGAVSDPSFDQGVYILSETNVAGYAASAWDCIGGTQNGSNITIALGQNATCTITNSDIPGTIEWEKRRATGTLIGGATFEINPDPLDGLGVLFVPDDVDGVTSPGDVDKNPAPGQFLITNAFWNTYTITELTPPPGFAGENDPTRTIIVGPLELGPVVGVQGVQDSCPDTDDGTPQNPNPADGDEEDFCDHLLGHIIIDKVTIGGDDTFSFDANNNFNAATNPTSPYNDFTLTGAQTPNDSGGLNPGIYTVTELIPAGWSLTNLVCSTTVVGSGTSSSSTTGLFPQPPGGAATASILLGKGDTVTCTFTNTEDATIRIVKEVVVANPGINGDPQAFTFTTTGTDSTAPLPPNNFLAGVTLDNFVTNTFPTSRTYTFAAGQLGAKTVTETPVPGWDLTDLVCTGGGGNTFDVGNVATIGLDAGETVVCTYTNTKRGHIIIVKDTLPNDPQDFLFANNFGNGNPAAFPLDDDADPTLANLRDSEVLPGTYAVSEGVVVGFDLTSVSCSDASLIGAIEVGAGETVTCTFVNTKRGSIWVIKDATPNDAQDFAFATTGTGLSNFSLDDDAGAIGANALLANNKKFANLLPGTYTITEGAVAGWNLTNIVFANSVGGNDVKNVGTRTATIVIDPGENIIVRFDNVNKFIVVTPDKTNSSKPYVHIVNATTGALSARFLAYDVTYLGGVRVATGDLNGDGFDEIVTAPGRNIVGTVKVFSQAGVLLHSFVPFGTAFNGGVNIAIGDVNGDGKNDIATAMDYNGSEVKVFKNTTTPYPTPTATSPLSFTSFLATPLYPYGSAFKGGASVKLVDMGTMTSVPNLNYTLDNKAEIIVGNGTGMRSTVYVYGFNPPPTAATVSATPIRIRTFLPFGPAFVGGVSLDVARVNLDGVPDIIVGTGPLGGSLVEIRNGANGLLLSGWTAFPSPSNNFPIHVTAFDANDDGIADKIIVAQGTDGTYGKLRRFTPLNPAIVDEILESAFDPAVHNDFLNAYFTAPLKKRKF